MVGGPVIVVCYPPGASVLLCVRVSSVSNLQSGGPDARRGRVAQLANHKACCYTKYVLGR